MEQGSCLQILPRRGLAGRCLRPPWETVLELYKPAAEQNPPRAEGHNGLGFIHFHGTKIRAQSFDLARRLVEGMCVLVFRVKRGPRFSMRSGRQMAGFRCAVSGGLSPLQCFGTRWQRGWHALELHPIQGMSTFAAQFQWVAQVQSGLAVPHGHGHGAILPARCALVTSAAEEVTRADPALGLGLHDEVYTGT